MSKGFTTTIRKRVEYCDTLECPYASEKHCDVPRTIHCGVLKRRIRWSVFKPFPSCCPKLKKEKKR